MLRARRNPPSRSVMPQPADQSADTPHVPAPSEGEAHAPAVEAPHVPAPREADEIQHIPAPREAEAPAPDEQTATGTPAAPELSERERQILAFENKWWKHAGAKEQAIRDA